MKKLILILIFSTVSFSEIVNYYNFRWNVADTVFDKKGSSNAIAYGGATFDGNGVFISNPTWNTTSANPQRIGFTSDNAFYHNYNDNFSYITQSRSYPTNQTDGQHDVFSSFTVGDFSNNYILNHIYRSPGDTIILFINAKITKTKTPRFNPVINYNKWSINGFTYETNLFNQFFNSKMSTDLSLNTGDYISGGFYTTGSKAIFGCYWTGSTYKLLAKGYSSLFIHFNHVLRTSEISNYNTYFKGGFQ